MAVHLRSDLVVAALEMALRTRRPAPGVVHHSDHGSQDTSAAFATRCQQGGVQLSRGTVGDCYDNAITESFVATLEGELLASHTFHTQDAARTAVFDYIEGFYNPHRRHTPGALA